MEHFGRQSSGVRIVAGAVIAVVETRAPFYVVAGTMAKRNIPDPHAERADSAVVCNAAQSKDGRDFR